MTSTHAAIATPTGILTELREAYAIGLQRRTEAAGRMHDDQGPGPAQFDGQCSEADGVRLDRCALAQYASVEAMKQGRHDEARALLAETRGLCETTVREEQALLWCEAFLLPAEAYVAFRSGALAEASRLLLRGIETDEVIESRYGCASRDGHRLHLVNNLVRVRARLCSPAEAIQLAADTLRFITGATDSGPTPGMWGTPVGLSLTPAATATLLLNTAAEAARILAGLTPDQARPLFEPLAQAMDAAGGFVWPARVIEWLRLKDSFTQGATEVFLQLAARYIRNTAQDRTVSAARLWEAVVADTVLILGTFEDEECSRLLEAIVKDSASSPGFPARLRQR